LVRKLETLKDFGRCMNTWWCSIRTGFR